MHPSESISKRISYINNVFTSHRFAKSLLFNSGLTVPILLSKGVRFEDIGFINSAYWITYGATQIPTGWLADKIGAGCILFAGCMIAGLSSIIFGFSDSYHVILISNIAIALGQSMISGSDSTLLRSSLQAINSPSKYKEIEYSGTAGRNAALLVSSAIAFIAVRALGMNLMYVLSGFSVIISGIVVIPLIQSTHINPSEQHSGRKESWSVLRSLKRDKGRICFLITMFAGALSLDSSGSILVQLVLSQMSFEPFFFSLAFGIINCIAVSIFLFRNSIPKEILSNYYMFIFVISSCIIMMLSAYSTMQTAIVLVSLSMIGFGIFKAIFYANTRSILVAAAPISENSQILSIASTAAGFAVAFQSLIIFTLKDYFGLTSSILEVLAICFIMLLIQRYLDKINHKE